MGKYCFNYDIYVHGKKVDRTEAKPEFNTKAEARKWIEKNTWLQGCNPRIIVCKR